VGDILYRILFSSPSVMDENTLLRLLERGLLT
jgi:hypothetical protein